MQWDPSARERLQRRSRDVTVSSKSGKAPTLDSSTGSSAGMRELVSRFGIDLDDSKDLTLAVGLLNG
jgi:hypothetical protein